MFKNNRLKNDRQQFKIVKLSVEHEVWKQYEQIQNQFIIFIYK